MPTTSNFGWTTPADTDLVKDGALAIRTLGNGIDTSFLDLKGGTTDQVLAKNSNSDLDFKWVAPTAGDIEGVTAGIGISGGGTSGTVTITNSMATEIDAKGDLVVGTGADTFARLAVGTNDFVLTAASGETTGIKWAALPASIPANAMNAVGTLEGTSSNSYTNLTTSGPTVTLTTGTKALVMLACEFRADDSNDNCTMGFEVSGASTIGADDTQRMAYPGSLPSTGIYICFSWVGIISGLTAGSNTFTCKYKNDGGAGTANFRNRRISVVNMGS